MGNVYDDDTCVNCSDCDYKYVSYGEFDIGNEEWSCELLERFLKRDNKNGGSCPGMYEEEEKICPLKVRYSVLK